MGPWDHMDSVMCHLQLHGVTLSYSAPDTISDGFVFWRVSYKERVMLRTLVTG